MLQWIIPVVLAFGIALCQALSYVGVPGFTHSQPSPTPTPSITQ